MAHYAKIDTQLIGTVGLIWLNEPDTRNAMSYQMLEDLNAAVGELSGQARALVLSGRGYGFCSGAGLNGIDGGNGAAPDYGLSLETHVNPLLTRLRDLPIPWITAVRGGAAGFGCSLALAGDLIVASESALFVQSFARVGLVPDGGSTYLLTRSLSRVRAMEMMLLGERITGRQAMEWGMVNRLVADDRLEEEALALATQLAEGPTAALRITRRMAWAALDANWELALRAEREGQRAAGLTADFQEGLDAFRDRRPPRFDGR